MTSRWIEQHAPMPDTPTPRRRQTRRPTASTWEAHPDRRIELVSDARVAAEADADARDRQRLDVELDIIAKRFVTRRDAARRRQQRPVVASSRPLGGSTLSAARADVRHPEHWASQFVKLPDGSRGQIFTGR